MTDHRFAAAALALAAFAASGALAAPKTLRDKGAPEMVVIPGGSFDMGIDGTELMRGGEGARPLGPVRRVTVKSFAIGATEVTTGQYRAFLKASGHQQVPGCAGSPGDANVASGWEDPGYGRPARADEPVVCVSWRDAKAYTAWLSGKTGKAYRLATEAEWEYVARAGSTARWAWGDDDRLACTYGNIANVDQPKTGLATPEDICRDGFVGVAPVKSFAPNAWGVYDMVGNVFEWVEDCSILPYPAAPTDGSAVEVSGACDKRGNRGGSWRTRLSRNRPWFRGRDPEPTQSQIFGFRIARDL